MSDPIYGRDAAANAVFYRLQTRARDAFVGWGQLDTWLRGAGEYPVFNFRREIH